MIIRNQDEVFDTKANKSDFFMLREHKIDKETLQEFGIEMDAKI